MTVPSGADLPRTLVVARHFPPSVGGIQTFTHQLVRRLDPTRVVVVTPQRQDDLVESSGPGAGDGCAVVRSPWARLVGDLAPIVREHGCTAAWVPAAAPYALLAPLLRRAGIERVVASTHGQEVAWLSSGPSRQAVRAIARSVDTLTCLGPYTAEHLRAVVDRPGALHVLAGGVDPERFPVRRPAHAESSCRVITVSRLVRRKGHDVLLRAWPRVLARVCHAELVVVGSGPRHGALLRASRRPELRGSVHVLGRVGHRRLLAELHAASVFVSPCRDRVLGLQIEGLGLSTLEASSTGLPVVVGRSGGSPDTVLDGRTGSLVDASDPDALAAALVRLLLDSDLASRQGAAGAAWVRKRWRWETSAVDLVSLLAGKPAHVPKIDW